MKSSTKTTQSKTAGGSVKVRVLRLPHGKELPMPTYHSEHAAGLDLMAAIGWDTPVTLLPGSRTLVPTGLSIELPEGYEAQVRPRSGLALASGITVLNSPGTIDADYRGEVAVLLVNLSGAPFEIRRGERIAQLIVAPVVRAELVEVEALAETQRGDGGFGSTGKLEAKETGTSETPAARAPAKRAAKPSKKTAAKPAAKKLAGKAGAKKSSSKN